MKPIIIERLFHLGGHQVAAHCPTCQHNLVLDTVARRIAHDDLWLADLAAWLRCENCRCRPCEISPSGSQNYEGPLYQPH